MKTTKKGKIDLRAFNAGKTGANSSKTKPILKKIAKTIVKACES